MLAGLCTGYTLTGHRIHPAVREGRAHHGDVARSDAHRALPEVGVERFHHRGGEGPSAPHEVGERSISIARLLLGRQDFVIDAQLATSEGAEAREDAAESLLGDCPVTSDVVTIAPALTIGFGGRRCRPRA